MGLKESIMELLDKNYQTIHKIIECKVCMNKSHVLMVGEDWHKENCIIGELEKLCLS